MMTEEELLAKLKELDPETYQILTKKIGDNVIIFEPWGEKIFGFILQGVIQDAIAANDNFIGFEIIYTSYFDVKYEATIFWDGTGSISQDGYGETAADAILAAYIAAREAEREAGR